MDRTYTTFKTKTKTHNVHSFTWVSRFARIWHHPLSKPVKLTNSYRHSYYSLYSSQTMSCKSVTSRFHVHLSPYSARPLQYYHLHCVALRVSAVCTARHRFPNNEMRPSTFPVTYIPTHMYTQSTSFSRHLRELTIPET